MPPLADNLVLRSFEDAQDDEVCQILEQRANQFGGGEKGGVRGLLRHLIEVFPGHPQGFAAKARLNEEYEIVVVADKNADNKAVAVVVVTIHSVTYAGASIKTGWLFDLRVDEDYQRQGIGRALSEEAERRCVARGVSLLHLTVNRDNKKAKGLYAALGYQSMSLRAPRTTIMQQVAKPEPGVVVMRLSKEAGRDAEAARLTAAAYDGVDMAPDPLEQGFRSLFCSELSEGTYIGVLRSELETSKSVQADAPLSKLLAEQGAVSVVEDKAQVLALIAAIDAGELPSHGGVSMWNGSKVQNWKVLRVIFKKDTWCAHTHQSPPQIYVQGYGDDFLTDGVVVAG